MFRLARIATALPRQSAFTARATQVWAFGNSGERGEPRVTDIGENDGVEHGEIEFERSLPTPGRALQLVDLFPPSRVAILDADYILDQVQVIVGSAEKGVRRWPGPPFDNSRTFASRHILTELYQADRLGNANKWEKLAGQGRQRGWDLGADIYRHAFEQRMLPLITYVEVGDMFFEEPEVVAVRNKDHKDAPTAQLAVLLSQLEPHVYSRDSALTRPRLAPASSDLVQVVDAGRSADAGEGMFRATAAVGGGIVLVVDGVLERLASLVGVARWLPWAALLGGLALWLLPKDRRETVLGVLSQISQVLGEIATEAHQAAELLALAAAQVAKNESLEARIAALLALKPRDEALSSQQVKAELDASPMKGATLAAIRSALRDNPCFIEGPRHRWRLGTNYAAATVGTSSAK